MFGDNDLRQSLLRPGVVTVPPAVRVAGVAPGGAARQPDVGGDFDLWAHVQPEDATNKLVSITTSDAGVAHARGSPPARGPEQVTMGAVAPTPDRNPSTGPAK